MTYRHVLCASDFSEISDHAVTRSAEVARLAGARLTLVHVIEHFPEDLPVGMGARENQDPREYLIDSARHRLSAVCERLGVAEAEQRVLVSRHSARHEILEVARHLAADLLVVGSSPKGLFSYMGSTASGLLHAAPCDLLVVKR